jgi:hypothetical protein
MSIDTIGAFAIGEYPEGVAVMLFFQIGEMFERIAVGRSRKSITALMDIRPDYANLKVGDKLEKVSPQMVSVGDFIAVRPGEKVPLDGVVTEGRSALDTSALTGESLPRDVEPDSEVLSGSVNKNGLLTIRVSKSFGDSTVSKILELVQNASSRKSKIESFLAQAQRCTLFDGFWRVYETNMQGAERCLLSGNCGERKSYSRGGLNFSARGTSCPFRFMLTATRSGGLSLARKGPSFTRARSPFRPTGTTRG